MAKKSKTPLSAVLILGIVLVGLLVSVVMISQGTGLRFGGAWDCTKYNFTVQQNGDVYVQNASANPEPATKVDVGIGDVLAATLNAPATTANSAAIKIGTVTVPSTGIFKWTASAHADRRCTDTGEYTQPAAMCNYYQIKVTQ